MAIRIMHVLYGLNRGGLENGLVNLIQRMDACRFEHVVCTVRGLGPNAERLPERVRVRSLDATGSSSRLQTPALIRVIREVRPDIVHSRNWGAIEAVVAARVARVRAAVHSEHGFEADASAPEPWRRVCFRRLAYELADRVLSVSRQLRESHATRTGFPASRITVIHNGVDSERFSPDRNTRVRVRQELGIGDAELCIGCVANLLPVKDHMTLLESLGVLADRRGDWRLLLIGEGPERPRLQAFVDARPEWKSRVVFLGSSNCVPDLLRAMDVFVLPSVAEGICNALLEAMSTGLPVIATAVGGNPEVVVDGKSGLLFAAGDARALANLLERLWTQPRLRTQLGEQAIRHVQNEFSMGSMVAAYDQLYCNLRPAAAVPALSAGLN
jgi:sugar transferase (PEP-CTERM/EpsH1 system associated)